MSITTIFSIDYKAQFSEYVSLLFHLAKTGESTAEERVRKVGELTEAYFSHVGKHADWAQLDRLGSLILRDELTDPHPDKMTLEEYPIMSESQRDERAIKEVSLIWADEVATDGRDYRLQTRDSNRKMREISGNY